jgi:hypothetical protein
MAENEKRVETMARAFKIRRQHFDIDLGQVWDSSGRYNPRYGYYAGLMGYTDGTAELIVGCHQFTSRKQAEKHWKGGENSRGEKRPQAAALIRFAAAEFKKRGYKW